MKLVWALVVACVPLLGCNSAGLYVVDVAPEGRGMKRRVAFYPEGRLPPLDAEDGVASPTDPDGVAKADAGAAGTTQKRRPAPEILGRLEASYGARDADGRWRGSFGPRCPGALGGSGAMDRLVSPLGTVFTYAERVGGTDDLLSTEAARVRAVDLTVRLLRDWLSSETRGHPGTSRLRRFIDTRVRRDLGVLTLVVAAAVRGGKFTRNDGTTLKARVMLYLRDRGYTRTLAPRLAGIDIIRGILRRELGVTPGASDPRCLGFLATSNSIERSLGRFLRSQREWSTHAARSERELGLNDGVVRPDREAAQRFFTIVARAMGLDFTFRVPSVKLRLRCQHTPQETNGSYEPSTGVVSWTMPLAVAPWPSAYAFASWARPSREGQERLFGSVLLEGDALARFVRLWAKLSSVDRARWAEVEALMGHGQALPEIRRRLRAWRSHTPADMHAVLDRYAISEVLDLVVGAIAARLDPPGEGGADDGGDSCG